MAEGAARATVLKVTQTEPSHGFVTWQALVDGYAPKSSNDPAIALQPKPATPKRCKDAKELKERLTAWSLKVAEYEHQFKVCAEDIRGEMMPKDIKREFLTGPRKFDEIMEQLEIIVNEMMADDGPTQTDLGSVGAYDAKTTQSGSDTSNDMSYEDVCAFAWKGYKSRQKKGQNGWHRGKGADEGTSGRRDDGAKKGGTKGSKGSKLDGTATRTREAMGAKGRARARVKPDAATIVESKGISGELSIQVGQQHRRRGRTGLIVGERA